MIGTDGSLAYLEPDTVRAGNHYSRSPKCCPSALLGQASQIWEVERRVPQPPGSHVCPHVITPTSIWNGHTDPHLYTQEPLAQSVLPSGLYHYDPAWATESGGIDKLWPQTSIGADNVDYLLDPVLFERFLMQPSASMVPLDGHAITDSTAEVHTTAGEDPSTTDDSALAITHHRRARNPRRSKAIARHACLTPTMSTPAVMERTDGRFFCSEIGCDTSYLRAGDCRRHMKTHGKPLFKCPAMDCNMTFHRADKMRDHVRQGHKGLFV